MGSRKRVVPYGFGFDLVTAPNYFFEIVAWVSVFMMTGSLMSAYQTLTVILAMLTVSISHSASFRRCGCWPDGDLGNQEAQNLQKGVWSRISSQQKNHIPICILILSTFPSYRISCPILFLIYACYYACRRHQSSRCWCRRCRTTEHGGKHIKRVDGLVTRPSNSKV